MQLLPEVWDSKVTRDSEQCYIQYIYTITSYIYIRKREGKGAMKALLGPLVTIIAGAN